jgi:hypothetical protein
MDPADLLILAVVACLDGLLLMWLRHRRRRCERDRKLSRMLARGLRQLARA